MLELLLAASIANNAQSFVMYDLNMSGHDSVYGTLGFLPEAGEAVEWYVSSAGHNCTMSQNPEGDPDPDQCRIILSIRQKPPSELPPNCSYVFRGLRMAGRLPVTCDDSEGQ